MAEEQGLTVTKEKNFSEWYTQVIQKADLADYSVVSGCIVYKPNSYALWEKIQQVVDKRFKEVGIKTGVFNIVKDVEYFGSSTFYLLKFIHN